VKKKGRWKINYVCLKDVVPKSKSSFFVSLFVVVLLLHCRRTEEDKLIIYPRKDGVGVVVPSGWESRIKDVGRSQVG
jgi:hypothetical protein